MTISRYRGSTFNQAVLKRWHDESGLRREQVCAQLGISYPYFAHLLADGGNPRADILVRLARLYGQDISELFDLDPAGAQ